jgi:hypothetical protein
MRLSLFGSCHGRVTMGQGALNNTEIILKSSWTFYCLLHNKIKADHIQVHTKENSLSGYSLSVSIPKNVIIPFHEREANFSPLEVKKETSHHAFLHAGWLLKLLNNLQTILSKFLTGWTPGSRLNLMKTDPPRAREVSVHVSTINLFHMSKNPAPRSDKWLPVSCHLSSCTFFKATQQSILYISLTYEQSLKLTNFIVISMCPETSGFNWLCLRLQVIKGKGKREVILADGSLREN